MQLSQQTGCTRASAVNTFDLQRVSDDVHGCVQVSGPNIRRSWSVNQWRVLSWGASDSKATACHAWGPWRVLYLQLMLLPARQSTFWNETRGFFSSDLWPLTAQIWTWLTTKFGEKCSGGSTNKSWWRWWTEAAVDQRLAWLRAKHYRWGNKWCKRLRVSAVRVYTRTRGYFIPVFADRTRTYSQLLTARLAEWAGLLRKRSKKKLLVYDSDSYDSGAHCCNRWCGSMRHRGQQVLHVVRLWRDRSTSVLREASAKGTPTLSLVASSDCAIQATQNNVLSTVPATLWETYLAHGVLHNRILSSIDPEHADERWMLLVGWLLRLVYVSLQIGTRPYSRKRYDENDDD